MKRCSEFSPVGKAASWILVAFLIVAAIINITHGQVPHPWSVVIVLVGFTLFVVSKLAVILYRERISFGTRLMTTPMANMYRLGYWLMVVGILATFL